jgi:hypothetical protein
MIRISWARDFRRLKKKSHALPYLYADGWLFTAGLEPDRVQESPLVLPIGTDSVSPPKLSHDEWFLMSDVTWGLLVEKSRGAGADRVRVLFEDDPDDEDLARLNELGYHRIDEYFDEYESMNVESAEEWRERQLWDVTVWAGDTPLVEMVEAWGTFLVADGFPVEAMHAELLEKLRDEHGLQL